ncbi:MAG: phosphoribosylglycinamide formyltransferase [Chitinophagales bacterium]
MQRLAIMASGNGTNAKNIIDHFKDNPEIKTELIICNNTKAKVTEVAQESNIPCYLISKTEFYETHKVPALFHSHRIDLIVLAGFLWMIPENILCAYPEHIINIHPALLPAYGGPGMYGRHVHEAVIAAKEKQTGITIHYLNDQYDAGEIIFQKSIPVEKNDTAETISRKVQMLEYEWYPKLIEKILSDIKKD